MNRPFRFLTSLTIAAAALFTSTSAVAGQGATAASRTKATAKARTAKVKAPVASKAAPKAKSTTSRALVASKATSKAKAPVSRASVASKAAQTAATQPAASSATTPAAPATSTGADIANSLAAAASNDGASLAQQLAQVAPASAGAAEFVVVNDNGRLWVFTAAGELLIENWNPVEALNGANRIVPTVAVSTVDSGISLTYTFKNNTAAVRELASLAMPEIALGTSVTAQDLRETGDDITLDASSADFYGTYPRRLYSPMTVIRNASTSVCVSVFYPVLEYRHDVRLSVERRDGGKWRTVIGLENTGHGYNADAFLFNKPVLAAGESRSYQVDIRFASSSDWISSTDAYKASFQAKYGAARYVRDARPIAGLIASMSGLISDSNPYGFVPSAGRPDLNGYGVLADRVESKFAGSDRVILWTPTGMQDEALNHNYPFLFTSHWNQGSEFGHSMGNAASELSSMSRPAGSTFGLWWGNAASVASHWNDGEVEALDPSNAAHMDAAFAELDGAVAAGATQIGLDAFSHAHSALWNLVGFLEAAKAKYPQLSFSTEGRGCDVLHLHAATWIDAYKCSAANAAEACNVKGRFTLAERLIPGCETWAGVYFNRAMRSDLHGDQPSKAAQMDEIRRIASLGFVPVVFQSGLDIANVQVAMN